MSSFGRFLSSIDLDRIDQMYNNYTSKLKATCDTVAQTPSRSWDALVQPLIDLDEATAHERAIINLEQLHTDKCIREGLSNTHVKLEQFALDQFMRRDVYRAWKAYYDNEFRHEQLTPERIHYFHKTMRILKNNGMELPDIKYDRVKAIKKELINLETKYNSNLSEDTTTLSFTKDQLTGMSDNWLQARKTDSSTYQVKLRYPDYFPIMESCSNRETRKQMYTAYWRKCQDVNRDLLYQALKLRQELAQLVGYDNYGDYILSENMAGKRENVVGFLNEINSRMSAYDDIEKLKSMLPPGTSLEAYDINYYTNEYTKKHLDLDKESLRQYFKVDQVTAGMLSIYQQLLGLKYEINPDASRWHDDVLVYKVYSSDTGAEMGTFYMDMYPRDGKYSHMCMMQVVKKSKNNKPIAFMICNMTKDNGLSFDEVKTYFHEFGHVMHELCADTTIGEIAGVACERDFVETPSQMFEEWCYDSVALKIMTGGMIPDNVIKSIQDNRYQLQALYFKRQLMIAEYDLLMHFNDVTMADLTNVYNRLHKERIGIDITVDFCFGSVFAHMMSGYSSMYYSYLWSLVYAKDIFHTKFKGDVLNSHNGKLLRDIVLAKGGSVNSADSLKQFLGRDPSIQAFVNQFAK
jgi:thimet oligopeptidase